MLCELLTLLLGVAVVSDQQLVKAGDYANDPEECSQQFNECGVSCSVGTRDDGPRAGDKWMAIHHNTLFTSVNPQAPYHHLHSNVRAHKCYLDPTAACGCVCK